MCPRPKLPDREIRINWQLNLVYAGKVPEAT